jgi:ABC-type branched-subunit amino acid transport system substrate-binding protein
MHSARITLASLAIVAMAATGASAVSADTGDVVIVPRGQPLQVAFTADTLADPDLAPFSVGFRRAIAMSVGLHPTIRNFPVKINDYETTCSGDNSASAAAIVANRQNVAVLGNICTVGLASALPIYEAGGLVTLSGSASGDELPALGPTVFNRTAVSDGDGGDAWHAAVTALRAEVFWSSVYRLIFRADPPDLADLYFDAANLLLVRLQQVSRISDGHLVIDRAALARAVRSTVNFPAVSCALTLDPATGNRVNDPAALARCAEPWGG